MENSMTNDNFTLDGYFRDACKLADTEPTRRQASRFRMGKGRAYKVNHIIRRAPEVPSWFEPNMDSDVRPAEIKFDLTPPGSENTPEEVAAKEEAALKRMQEIEDRNREIQAWNRRHQIQKREQWPKFWAHRQLGLA